MILHQPKSVDIHTSHIRPYLLTGIQGQRRPRWKSFLVAEVANGSVSLRSLDPSHEPPRAPYKFALTSLVFLSVIAAMSLLLLSRISDDIGTARAKKAGVEYVGTLKNLLTTLQQHRGMATALLSGDRSFAPKLAEKKAQVDKALKDVEAADERHGTALKTTPGLDAVKSRWKELAGTVRSMKSEVSFAAHTALVAEVIVLAAQTGDASKLVLESEPDAYYLAESALIHLPAVLETRADTRLGFDRGRAGRFARRGRRLSAMSGTIRSGLDSSNGRSGPQGNRTQG